MKKFFAVLALAFTCTNTVRAQNGLTTLSAFQGLPYETQYAFVVGVYETHVLQGIAGTELSCMAPTGTSRSSIMSMLTDQLKNSKRYTPDSIATSDIHEAMCALWPPSDPQNTEHTRLDRGKQ